MNFAIFLNDRAADFDAAEKYAQKALGTMEFPMARYHLAAARYQKIGSIAATLGRPELVAATEQVGESTHISLTDAIAFPSFSSVVRGRLKELQSRLR